MAAGTSQLQGKLAEHSAEVIEAQIFRGQFKPDDEFRLIGTGPTSHLLFRSTAGIQRLYARLDYSVHIVDRETSLSKRLPSR
jgi:uroporphyrinogen-III synthase